MVSKHCNLLGDPSPLLGNIAWLIVLAMPADLGTSVYPQSLTCTRRVQTELPLPSLMKAVTCFGGSLL